MKKLGFKFLVLASLFVITAVLFTSCKSKKLAAKEEVVAQVVEAPKPIEKKVVDTDGDGVADDEDDCPQAKGLAKNNGCPEIVEKAFVYQNIQFEFNSSVLKTSSYAFLEDLAQQIKKYPEATIYLNGHSSSEGTDLRNMMLSVDRANAVKAYLVNNGIANSKLITKGFGESVPLVPNTSEANKALNRRVEIKPSL